MATLRLSRAQLASFLKDPEQIKQFEMLFAQTNENTDSITIDLVIAIGNALAMASEAMAEIERLKARMDHEPPVAEDIRQEPWVPVHEPYTLTAGSGLTGGGNMGANVTVNVGAGTGITVNADDVALDTAHARNVDHSAVTITAGAGLTGGGTIEATRTLDVGAGTGITVNANDVALDTASTRNADHATITITAGVALSGGGDLTASRTINLEDTAVTPNTYSPVNSITVDQQGRITAIS